MSNGLYSFPKSAAIEPVDQFSTVYVEADGNVNPGELLTLQEMGLVSKSNGIVDLATVENNNSSTAIAVKAATTLVNNGASTYFTLATEESNVTLQNGNVALLYSGNGSSSATTRLNLTIHNINGNTINDVIVDSGASISAMRIKALSNGNALLCWRLSSALYYAIYSPYGIQVVAPTVVHATTTLTSTVPCEVLSTGDFIIAYDKSNVGLYFKRYNVSGVAQGTEVTVESASVRDYPVISPLENGGFVLSYKTSTVYGYRRYSSVGVATGSFVTVGIVFEISMRPHERVVELSNNNIAILGINTSDTKPNVVIYNASDTLVNTVIVGGSSVSGGSKAAICKTPLGFGVVYHGAFGVSVNLYCKFYDTVGNVLSPEITSAYHSGTAYTTLFGLYAKATATGITIVNFATIGANYEIVIYSITYAGQVVSSRLAVYSSASSISTLSITPVGAGIFHLFWRLTAGAEGVAYAVAKAGRSSILGVAQKYTPSGSLVPVATKGSFTLPSSQTMMNGRAFNARTNAVPGNRGMVSGRAVLLLGLDSERV